MVVCQGTGKHASPSFSNPMHYSLMKHEQTDMSKVGLYALQKNDYHQLVNRRRVGRRKQAENKGQKMPIVQSIEDLTESFALMDDWEDRYALLIDVGRQLPEFPESEKIEANLVKGCVSRVWMLPRVTNGMFTFIADSDAHIVKGLVALLYVIYNGQSVEQISLIDIHAIFTRLGLDQNLSPNLRNGFFSMVEKIKSYGA